MDTPKMSSFFLAKLPGDARGAAQLHVCIPHSLEDRVYWTDAEDEVAVFPGRLQVITSVRQEPVNLSRIDARIYAQHKRTDSRVQPQAKNRGQCFL